MNHQRVLASGTFHPVARPGAGWVRVVSHGSHRANVQLINIRLRNAPELEVRFVAASDVLDSSTAEAAAYLTVGSLPAGANSGEYDIDAVLDLNRYRAVTLWSTADHLNFMTAPLQVAGQSSIGANER
jgi:hypothetical protein